jgi:large subunit ribosomal protein L19
MFATIQKIEAKYKKPKVVDVRSGDVVRVHQRIKEGTKERVQVFEGLVIKTSSLNSISARLLVRRISSGVGVEKSFLLHSPLVEKIEIVKRSKVRRNYLSYMRERRGKSARLSGVDFDKEKVNDVFVPADTTKAAKEAEAELTEVEITDNEAVQADQNSDKEPAKQEKVEKTDTESTPAIEDTKAEK